MPRDGAPQPSTEEPNGAPATDASAGPPRLTRRAFLRLMGVGVVAAGFGSGVSAAYRFDVVPITTPLAGLRRPVTVAWLSDLHFGPFIREGSVSAWVSTTLDLRPDLVLLGGDIVDHLAPADVRPLFRQLARLEAPLGVFAVRGNHEYARFGRGSALEAFETGLADVGVTPLVNEGRLVRDDLWLAGMDDNRVGGAAWRSAMAGRPDAPACLAASHQPNLLERVPETVQLTLCGHTHGGQVRIPGIGPVITRTRLGRANESGWVRAPALGYVSRGLGVVHLPVRLNCPAELTFATLTPRWPV